MKVRRSREWWRRTVAAQVTSGLRLSEYAAREGLVEATLRWWASELRGCSGDAPVGGGFIELVGGSGAHAMSSAGVPDDGEAPWRFGIRVGSGVTVLAGALPAPEYVARLAAAYDECRS